MSTSKATPRPTIDVNKNGIQTSFAFKYEETPVKKVINSIKKKYKVQNLQLHLIALPKPSKKKAPKRLTK